MSYAELHCHSNYSFQEGASFIHELAARARALGYPALALTDHDNLCGAMEFAQTAKAFDLQPIIGAEVTVAPWGDGDGSQSRRGLSLRAAGGGGDTPGGRRGNLGWGLAKVEEQPPPSMSWRGTTRPRPSSSHENVPRRDPPPETHLTLLAATREGYRNLCRLLSAAHAQDRRSPALDPALLAEHAGGLIALSGCRRGEVPGLAAAGRTEEAEAAARRYREWFGPQRFYLELQHNLVYGDDQRIRALLDLSRRLDLPVATTNDVHYHVRARHRLQDALVAIKACKSLEESHRERRPNSEFFLKSPEAMGRLFGGCPEALHNTLAVAESCSFDLTRDLDYRFPDYPVPEGCTADTYLERLCWEAARSRYGLITEKVRARLEEEFRLIRKHGLAGFLLIYHDIIQIAREVMMDLGLCPRDARLEEYLPGRGRGSSVAMLVGYLIGLSHIDPLQYDLSLERFLPEDFASVPDIDLDFPRNIREELIKRVHQKWGWEHAALAGMIDTYQARGAIRDLGKALGLPQEDVDKLAKRVEHIPGRQLRQEMLSLPDFRDKVEAPGWRDLLDLAEELDGFPKYLAQHPGGMIISSTPLTDMVPVQPGAIEARYICQWDKDAIDDAGFVKIDFLSLGALSQIQEALQLIQERHGTCVDLSRIDFDDPQVYAMLHQADTIGVFQVESAAQQQTIIRLKPRNLTDMAHEVGAVRPGVGVLDGVSHYLARRQGHEPVTFDHELERRALERTLGVILFQDQVNQVAIDVAGFTPGQADQLRRAFGRRHNRDLIESWWQKFRDGTAGQGVDEETARRVFQKFNGEYMFPESHAFAFGVTAYQATWLKRYYPLEFYVGLFNQQPMGFYNLETIKEDARRHDVLVLNPDINLSRARCIAEGEALRLGFLQVRDIAEATATGIEEARGERPFASLADFMERTGVVQRIAENLVEAGAFDALCPDRRTALQEVALRYRPQGRKPIKGDDRSSTLASPHPRLPPFGPAQGRLCPPDVPPPPPAARNDIEGDGFLLSFVALSGVVGSHPPAHKDSSGDTPGRDTPGPGRKPGFPAPSSGEPSSEVAPGIWRPPAAGSPRKEAAPRQLALPLPVEQDLLDVPPQTGWERMEGEYRTLGLFPAGHVMAFLRRRLGEGVVASNLLHRYPEGATLTTAGLVIRRQHPVAKAVFYTLEDEFGHIPLIIWPAVHQRYKIQLKEPFIIVTGKVSRRDGTLNIIVDRAHSFRAIAQPPKAKDWS